MSKPKIVVVPFKAWSPSALRDYDQCPLKAMLERTAKMCPACFRGKRVWKEVTPGKDKEEVCDTCGVSPPPKGPALVRGDLIHGEAESFVKGLDKKGKKVTKLSDNLKSVSALAKELRAAYSAGKARVELEIAFTRKWILCDWRDWANAWVRIKMDVMAMAPLKSIKWMKPVKPTDKVVSIIDWKTGQFKPGDYDDALSIYGTAALSAGFGEETRSALVFTDHGEVVDTEAGVVKRANLVKEQKRWEKRASKMFVDKTFAPKPGMQCRYCAFSTNKGGPCRF